MGRFLQHDPIGTSDDINLYRYVKNNPLNFTDAFGLAAKPLVLVISFFSENEANGSTSYWESLALSRTPNANIINKLASNKKDYNRILDDYSNMNVMEVIIASHANAGAMKFGTDAANINSIKNDYGAIARIESLKYLTLAGCNTGDNGGITYIEDISRNKIAIKLQDTMSYASEVSKHLTELGKNTEVFAPDGEFYPNLNRVGIFNDGNVLSFPSGNSVDNFTGLSSILIPGAY